MIDRLNTVARMAIVVLFIWTLNHYFPWLEEKLYVPAVIFCAAIIVAVIVVQVHRRLRNRRNNGPRA